MCIVHLFRDGTSLFMFANFGSSILSQKWQGEEILSHPPLTPLKMPTSGGDLRSSIRGPPGGVRTSV